MRIEALTRQALGRAGDGTLVPRVLPGEEIELVADGGVRILEPSPDRVTPPCRHYRTCGGCALQHASDHFVAGWKREVVMRALAARAVGVEVYEPLTSPPRSRLRAKFAGRRTKSGATVGFHARGSDQIVAVPECEVVRPEIAALLPVLAEITRRAATRRSEVGLTVTSSLQGLDLHVETERDLDGELRIELAQIANRSDLARLTWNDEPVVVRRPPEQEFGPARVTPPPGAFLQATAEGEADLVDVVLGGTDGAARVADLFAGCGTFALPLASRAEVHAVEGDAAMLAALVAGWKRRPGLFRVTTETRDLFRRPLLPDELRQFDAVVLDPPRAGAEAQVAALAEARVKRIVMVSCNPVTFARDVATLVGAGYVPDVVTVVDQFRWSPHVEVATRLDLAG